MSDLKKPFAVGDKVRSEDFGEGEIVHILLDGNPNPIGVEFITGKLELYTIDGRWMFDSKQTLFHIESEPNTANYFHEIALPSNTLNLNKVRIDTDYKRYFIGTLLYRNDKDESARTAGFDVITKDGKYINKQAIEKQLNIVDSQNLVILNVIELSKEDYEEYTRTTDNISVETDKE